MIFKNTGMWDIEIADGMYDGGNYSSREIALQIAKEQGSDSIGQVYTIEFNEEDLYYKFDEISSVLYELLYDKVGDIANLYEIPTENEDELARLLAETAIEYINEHNLQPNVFAVHNIEEVRKDY